MENPRPSKSDFRNRWIESLGKWLLPESEVIRLNDLLDKGMPPREFAWETAVTISRSTQSVIGRGFRLERTVLEAAVMSVPFWSAPLLPAIAAVIPVVAVLRVREAMIFPGDGSPGEMTADALVAASTLLISQLVFWSAAPSLVLGTVDLARGTAIGLLSVSLLRVVFHLNTPKHNPDRERATTTHRKTLRIMVMWLVACLILLLTNLAAVPATRPERDSVLIVALFVVFSTAYRYQSPAIGGVFDNTAPTSLFSAQEAEMKKMKEMLWTGSDIFLMQLYEGVFFLLMMFPMGTAIWRWLHGVAANIAWPLIWTNALSTGILFFLWVKVKKLNKKAAEKIDEVIDENKHDGNHPAQSDRKDSRDQQR
jgi:hypothetical protein